MDQYLGTPLQVRTTRPRGLFKSRAAFSPTRASSILSTTRFSNVAGSISGMTANCPSRARFSPGRSPVATSSSIATPAARSTSSITSARIAAAAFVGRSPARPACFNASITAGFLVRTADCAAFPRKAPIRKASRTTVAASCMCLGSSNTAAFGSFASMPTRCRSRTTWLAPRNTSTTSSTNPKSR